MATQTTDDTARDEHQDNDRTDGNDRLKRPPAGRSEPRDEADGGDADPEKERMRAALAKANKEAKTLRLRMDEIEAAEREKKEAELGEADRFQKQRDDADRRAREAEARAAKAEAELREREVASEVEREARRQGWAAPELAWRLVNRDLIARDEDTGKITGVREAVDKFGKEYPQLTGDAPPGGYRFGGTPPGRDASARRDGPPPGPGANGRVSAEDRAVGQLIQSGGYHRL